MKLLVREEIKEIIKSLNLNCTIKEFKDKVDWHFICKSQTLSENFIREFKDKVDVQTQIRSHRDKRTLDQKREEVVLYAEKYNLKVTKNYLYAYRDHDKRGCGVYNKTIMYKTGHYYRDWHCDLDSTTQNAFGLGIFPKGNTKVKVKIKDWGVEVKNDEIRGKARVWGFQII